MLRAFVNCMQSIPLAVLKRYSFKNSLFFKELHAIHTACGIETWAGIQLWMFLRILHAIHTACGIFFIFRCVFFKRPLFLWHNGAIEEKIFPGRDSDVCHLYDVGGNESD